MAEAVHLFSICGTERNISSASGQQVTSDATGLEAPNDWKESQPDVQPAEAELPPPLHDAAPAAACSPASKSSNGSPSADDMQGDRTPALVSDGSECPSADARLTPEPTPPGCCNQSSPGVNDKKPSEPVNTSEPAADSESSKSRASNGAQPAEDPPLKNATLECQEQATTPEGPQTPPAALGYLSEEAPVLEYPPERAAFLECATQLCRDYSREGSQTPPAALECLPEGVPVLEYPPKRAAVLECATQLCRDYSREGVPSIGPRSVAAALGVALLAVCEAADAGAAPPPPQLATAAADAAISLLAAATHWQVTSNNNISRQTVYKLLLWVRSRINLSTITYVPTIEG